MTKTPLQTYEAANNKLWEVYAAKELRHRVELEEATRSFTEQYKEKKLQLLKQYTAIVKPFRTQYDKDDKAASDEYNQKAEEAWEIYQKSTEGKNK